jgi:hypothetical protein
MKNIQKPDSYILKPKYEKPRLQDCTFTRKSKSPRRLLLAKRALMVKEKEMIQSKGRKSSSTLSTCQCFGQPNVCTICTSRYVLIDNSLFAHFQTDFKIAFVYVIHISM